MRLLMLFVWQWAVLPSATVTADITPHDVPDAMSITARASLATVANHARGITASHAASRPIIRLEQRPEQSHTKPPNSLSLRRDVQPELDGFRLQAASLQAAQNKKTTGANTTNMTAIGIQSLENEFQYLSATTTPEPVITSKQGMLSFPNLDFGAGKGNAYLLQSPGSTVVTKYFTHCLSDDACMWLYTASDSSLKVKSPHVCGMAGSPNFTCCLQQSESSQDNDVVGISAVDCTQCAGQRCQWCMSFAGGSTSVVHPKSGDSCEVCNGIGCKCLGARKPDGLSIDGDVRIQEPGTDRDCTMIWVPVS